MIYEELRHAIFQVKLTSKQLSPLLQLLLCDKHAHAQGNAHANKELLNYDFSRHRHIVMRWFSPCRSLMNKHLHNFRETRCMHAYMLMLDMIKICLSIYKCFAHTRTHTHNDKVSIYSLYHPYGFEFS